MTIKQSFKHSCAEKGQIADAIGALNRAAKATDEASFITACQAAFSLNRQLIRGRLD